MGLFECVKKVGDLGRRRDQTTVAIAATFLSSRPQICVDMYHESPLFERARARGVDPKTLMALEQFEADIERDPQDAEAYGRMGDWWYHKKQYEKAIQHLNTALDINPLLPYALCSRADIRATCPEPQFRDALSAVADASKAIELADSMGMLIGDWRQRMFLRVLAAAYAESGDFERAIEIENESMKCAITKSARRNIQGCIDRYGRREPTRSPRGTH